MLITMKNVLVFKTSVSEEKDINKLRPVLNALTPPTDLWNFDLEDCDNILRIETQNLRATAVLDSLHTLGYLCEELH
ncbi:hypothetical protein SAMN02745246_00936 [Leeuwenhoekiella marinoflava DSM 3653]|uniref:Copper chaperone CopZ n=3 Tax=Leeuwenhoekiella marinoflava TaxID=988 RepID=A0A4Q0PPG4_9FLAO|nr:hypothetical protein DSL99_739 [Leeuwenhoekiella marinoflava]SHE72426.1 hypothetical protein SAMN02745246_00936 [Leeuwenhoekiella marinoflava DSM 3653]